MGTGSREVVVNGHPGMQFDSCESGRMKSRRVNILGHDGNWHSAQFKDIKKHMVFRLYDDVDEGAIEKGVPNFAMSDATDSDVGVLGCDAEVVEDFATTEASIEASRGIGWAVKKLNAGKKIQRRGWNGKGMFLFLVTLGDWGIDEYTDCGDIAETVEPIAKSPFVVMKTADHTLVPWLASQTDLLATDWEEA